MRLNKNYFCDTFIRKKKNHHKLFFNVHTWFHMVTSDHIWALAIYMCMENSENVFMDNYYQLQIINNRWLLDCA